MMRPHCLTIAGKPALLLAAGLALAACTPTADEPAQANAEAAMMANEPAMIAREDIKATILDWWPGDYDNDAQIAAFREDGVPIWVQGQSENGGPSMGGFLPVTSYYRTVDLPAFGGEVLYLEEFTFGDDPYRHRIYTVIDDPEAEQVRVKLYYFSDEDKERLEGTWNDLSGLAALTPDDMSPLPDNCDLYVTPMEDGRLEMKMPKDQCVFGSTMFDYQVILGPDEFWYRDRIVNAETGEFRSTAGSFGWHKLVKEG
ncbi:MAG: chromophore lyase CpcT/CpeT [Pacificimonas sp.]|nr:chromophore lyase CpcT/CpeT [Pacificimonas sp.]